MKLPTMLPWNTSAQRWASILNPLLANPINNVSIITANLVSGTNVINHGLGKTQQGWIITDQNGVASIYRNAPFNDLTLSLHSSAAVTVSIGVF